MQDNKLLAKGGEYSYLNAHTEKFGKLAVETDREQLPCSLDYSPKIGENLSKILKTSGTKP